MELKIDGHQKVMMTGYFCSGGEGGFLGLAV